MAAPSYTEDLTDFALAETGEGTGGTYWDESTDANWDDGGNETFDSDYPLNQGFHLVSPCKQPAGRNTGGCRDRTYGRCGPRMAVLRFRGGT